MSKRVFGTKKRKSIEFEYEFKDGTKESFEYKEASSKEAVSLIKAMESGKNALSMELTVEIFRGNLSGGNVDKLVDEAYNEGNIFTLVEELNKLLDEAEEKK